MTGSPLASATNFVIPGSLLDATLEVLAGAGADGHEAFVVWGGRVSVDKTTLNFTSYHVPRQVAHKLPEGLLVTVDGEALFQLNRDLYKAGDVLAGQVHSHPTDAYHSDTDDHFPLVTLLGALSVVIPDFAVNARASVKRWAWYRLIGEGRWSELTRGDHIEIRGSV